MQNKKLITYLTCEKFADDVFSALEQRYKCTKIKDVITIELNEDQQIILFKYGVFVCWNIDFENMKFFADFIKNYEINSFEQEIIEELNYTVADEFKIHFDTISISDASTISKIAIFTWYSSK